MTLNGATLTNLVITGSLTNRHVSYSGLQANSLYTATITFQNMAGAGYTTTINFDTYSPNNFMQPSAPKRKGQRREPAASDVEFVSDRIGWLPFAAP